VLLGLVLFVLVYGVVFSMGIYYINRLIEYGPKGVAAAEPEGLPSRPLSAAEDAANVAMEET
jgi:cytochrome d ubiquinol oxidase subunit I